MTRFFLLLTLLFTTQVFAVPIMGRKYDNVVQTLQTLAAQYPQNAKLINIGTSDSGRDIIGLKIGDGSVSNLVVGTHHGNEYGSTEVALAFAEEIARTPVDGQTIFVIPVLNIAGYDRRSREEFAGSMWHDPNRNYPGPCGSEGPFTLKSTAALAALIEREHIVTSATIHTHFPAVTFPWGVSTHDVTTPYNDIFQSLADVATFLSHYRTGTSTDIVYPVDGSFEDYAYWKHGVWSLLFEVGYSHSPNQAALEELVRVNVPGLRRMFETAPMVRATDHGFKGQCSLALKILDQHNE